jgi:hypothetical protein
MVALGLAVLVAATLLGADPAPAAEPQSGRYRRTAPELSAEQRRRIEELEAIGYVSGSLPIARSGVTRHIEARTSPGLNLYTAGHAAEAVLMDMEGRSLHRWRKSFREVWPDHPWRDHPTTGWWRRVHLLPGGELLAIFAGRGVIKLDAGSNLIWAIELGAHHDLEVMPDGTIYLLTRKAHMVPRVNARLPISEDFITVLAPDGRVIRDLSVLRAVERSDFARIWEATLPRAGDVFHTNSLRVLDGRLAKDAPAFAKGNVLTSLLNLNVILVIDLEEERVVWWHQGDFKAQHDPQILANGNLLLFDNRGRAGASSVQELDVPSMELRWIYRGSEEQPFFSDTCGTAQRLPSGNTLMTESDGGRAFEVTPDGEVVWEFYVPHRTGATGELIATLFELERLPPDLSIDWAEGNP